MKDGITSHYKSSWGEHEYLSNISKGAAPNQQTLPTNKPTVLKLTPAPSALQELVCPGAEPRWSLAELIHAVVLMAQAHSLSSFVWGCGLNPEPDHIGGYTFQPPSPSHLHRSPHSPAHEDGRQEVSRTGVFHHRYDSCKCNYVKSRRTKRKWGPSCLVSLVTPVL